MTPSSGTRCLVSFNPRRSHFLEAGTDAAVTITADLY